MNQCITLTSWDGERNRQARLAAQAQVSWPVNLAAPTLSYISHGHLLIVGSELAARLFVTSSGAASLLKQADSFASITLLINAPSEMTDTDDSVAQALEATVNLACYHSRRISLSGYLGRFSVWLEDETPIDLAKAALGCEAFDLILDLGDTPLLALELPPPGYFHVSEGQDNQIQTLNALVEQIGEFDKPQYVQINAELCAHHGRGKIGCTRCLAVCPADAIKSVKQRVESYIEIDPYLCHGAGSCTSACPSGAIEYRLPRPLQQQNYVRRLLDAYRKAGGEAPVIRFVDATYLENENQKKEGSDPLAGHVLDIPLEEQGAAGLDHWLGALADGASQVRIQWHADIPISLTTLLEDQLEQAHRLLNALGHAPQRIVIINETDKSARDAIPRLAPIAHCERDSAVTGKRERLNESIAWLACRGEADGQRHSLPGDAPFGGLEVDQSACTLCMACVSICPTPALGGGDDHPMLSFREADCIQCGLCEKSCPENAIALQPGFLAHGDREERHICKEEAPFHCIACGKPFASQSAIATIKAKLIDHPYFAGDAVTRLEMCEDCRVRDIWKDLGRDPLGQLKI